jgi:ATP-dependent helicase HrpA
LAWSKDRLADLEAEPLPITVAIDLDGRSVEMHPALVETPEGVSLRLEADLDRALASTHAALRRFFTIAAREAIGHHLEYHPRWPEVEEAFGGRGASAREGGSEIAAPPSLAEAVANLVAEAAFRIDPRAIREAQAFERRLEQGERELFAQVDRVVVALAEAGRARRAIERRLDEPSPSDWASARAAIRRRLDALDPRDASFVAELLPGLPRYAAALLVRLDRLRGAGPRRDALDAAAVGAFEARLAATGLAEHDPRARRLRVLLEEAHVATFADRLGTSEPVSPSRLERAFEEVLASRGW